MAEETHIDPELERKRDQAFLDLLDLPKIARTRQYPLVLGDEYYDEPQVKRNVYWCPCKGSR